MQQIYEVKVITLTRGGLAGEKKIFFPVVTTNCKKSAEVIVPREKNFFGKDRTIISSE